MKAKDLALLVFIGGSSLLSMPRNAAATPLPTGLYDAKDCGGAKCFQVQNLNTSATAVGIVGVVGTSSPVAGSGTGVYGSSPSGSGVFGYTLTGNGVKGVTDNGTAVLGVASLGYGGYFQTGPGSGTALYATSDIASGTGLVAVGVTAAWLQGNVYSTGTYFSTGSQTAIQHFSDARLKKNIKPLEPGALDQLLRLHGVTYEWRTPEEHGHEYGPRRGFIAQDVEQVFPDWVGVEPKSGMKTVNMQGLEPLLVESLRTLRNENGELRAQSARLEERLKALESRRIVSASNVGGPLGMVGLGLAAGAFVLARRRRATP